jgi:hypothetical protein
MNYRSFAIPSVGLGRTNTFDGIGVGVTNTCDGVGVAVPLPVMV